MSHRFYRIKEICMDLGISAKTLYRKIEVGQLPKLEYPNPINTRVAGYSEHTFRSVIQVLTQSTQSTQSREQELA